VPFAPGGSSDVLARLIQPGLGAALGQSIIVENRSGAGSMLGTEAVARARRWLHAAAGRPALCHRAGAAIAHAL
jgi:tripartite-type tricarboxylate transporter receptor subunit TctC